MTRIKPVIYTQFDHLMPDIENGARGVKSLLPLTVQCDHCFLSVSSLMSLLDLLASTHFMMNSVAVSEGDRRRLCPACQLSEWESYLPIHGRMTANKWLRIQHKRITGKDL